MNSNAEATEWNDLDDHMVRVARGLVIDTIENAKSGHPGASLALTPLLYLLYSKVMKHSPSNPKWENRDRLVLSCGHASSALYTKLFLHGYDLDISHLKALRQLGSKTPGHPEFGLTPGVEVSTGPLGQGLATSVGMALSLKYQNQLNPSSGLSSSRVFVIASDGDMHEGISHEAMNLAKLNKLDNLVVLYDSNNITIDGTGNKTSLENTEARVLAMGWNVVVVDKLPNGEIDIANIWKQIAAPKIVGCPKLIIFKSTIGWPSPNLQNTAKVHGSPLGQVEAQITKKVLDLDPRKNFEVPSEVLNYIENSKLMDKQRESALASQTISNRNKKILDFQNKLHELIQSISAIEFKNSISTRAANRQILDCLKENSYGVIGGSADLTESNSMSLDRIFADSFDLESPGDNISFGVREHAMSALINGLAVESNSIPYCATYLAFSDFQKPAIRMAALMNLFVTYMWTHDSLIIGADGPTHQPIEQLAMLRSTPNFSVVRPADGKELQVSWLNILKRQQPTGLVLSRQNLPILDLDTREVQDAAKGAYVVRHSHDADKPDLIIIATGSEVHLAVAVHEQINGPSAGIRVVSMPCMEWFRAQEQEYKNSILPPQVKKRIIVEAASRFGWAEFVGLDGKYLTADTFGASADGEMLMSQFGFTEENLKSLVFDLLEDTNL